MTDLDERITASSWRWVKVGERGERCWLDANFAMLDESLHFSYAGNPSFNRDIQRKNTLTCRFVIFRLNDMSFSHIGCSKLQPYEMSPDMWLSMFSPEEVQHQKLIYSHRDYELRACEKVRLSFDLICWEPCFFAVDEIFLVDDDNDDEEYCKGCWNKMINRINRKTDL